MQRTSVSSTSVESVGYEEDNETLEIEFKNGAIYQYFDVPVNVYNALISAGSIGAYMTSNIKGAYRFTRV